MGTWLVKHFNYIYMNIFVAKLPFSVTSDELKDLFETYGAVVSAKVIVDKNNNNRSKGYGFVEMSNAQEAKRAIEKMNGFTLDGRKIVVTEAKPREERNFNSTEYQKKSDNRGNKYSRSYR